LHTSLIALNTHSRRTVLALLLATVAAAACLFGSLQHTNAMGVWCSGDPTILVNGNPVSITVSVPMDRIRDIDDVTVTYHVPKNADVALTLNTGILFRETAVIVKDQPAVRGGLIAVTKIPVDVTVHHRGSDFPIATTTIALGGTDLWNQGDSATVLHANTYGLLNLNTGGLLGGLRLF
jgi:hypothetical protein